MKAEREYIVYVFDEHGAERKWGTIHAKSRGQAMARAVKQGASLQKIGEVVLKEEQD